MCDSTGNHSHAHGVRSELEKSLGDIRSNLSSTLDFITRIEAQIAIIAEADFPQAGRVTHVLEHVKTDEKKNASRLLSLVNTLDAEQGAIYNELTSELSSGHHCKTADKHEHSHA